MNKSNCSPSASSRVGLILIVALALLVLSVALYRMRSDSPNPVEKTVQAASFHPFTLLKVNGKVLGDEDKITFGSPEFADWDGDGQVDLILGYWSSWGLGPGRGAGNGGRVRFYRNVGELGVPEYRDMGDLCHDEAPIRLAEARCAGAISPHVVDFNNDGKLDLIIGEYGVKTGTPTGKVRFFERQSSDLLKLSVALQCAGKDIANRYTSPCMVDWNNDGKLDLVLGSNHEVPQLFINTGTREAYQFDGFAELTDQSGKKIGMRYGRQQIRVLDFDGDGRKDLITCGWNAEEGGERFFFYRNIASDQAPQFAQAQTLKYTDGSDVTTRKKHCNARFAIHDYNADGVLDLIFVDYRDNYYNPVKICLGALSP